MADDLDKKIKQITELLSQENMPDNIKSLLSLLANSESKESEKPAKIHSEAETKNENNDLVENVEMMRKVKAVMERMNSRSDPRINLLTAIRPFLNEKRQKKISNCIKMIQMSSIAALLDEQEESKV